MNSINMRHVKHSADIDLTTWTIIDGGSGSAVQDIEVILRKEMTATLREVLKENPPELSFGRDWGIDGEDGYGGPQPSDAATVYVGLPLGPEDNYVVYSLSLEAAVDEVLELHFQPLDSTISEHGQLACRAIAARLRELAAKLEGACADGPPASD
jgi:hypothetical protein